MGKRRHAASGRLGRGCPRLRLGPQKARAAPPPASSLQLFRRRRAALRQAAAALHHTRCTCRAACRLRVPVEHAADRRLRGRKITGLPARARHDERRAPPWPVRSRAYHLKVTPSPVVKKGYSGTLWWVPKGLLCQNLDFWHVKHGEKVLCLGGKSVSLRWRLAKTHVATFRGRTATNLAF